MKRKPNKRFPVLLCALMLFLTGCMPLRPVTDPWLDQKAFSKISPIQSYNRHITASKGKGWARLEVPGKTDRYRMAFAAVYPDKVRLTLLMSGTPVETIVSNGENIIFLSHTGKHDLYTTQSKDPDMKDYIDIPVKLSEMLAFLLGHIPLGTFHDVYFSPQDPSLMTIVTREKEKGLSQQLHFNDDGSLGRMESLNNFFDPLYDIHILEYSTFGPDRLPSKLLIQDREKRKLTLEISDFESNPVIKDSVFQLTE